MTLYVIRHASAGPRGQFDGDDVERPLDAKGRAQSHAIADALSERRLARLLSSQSVRCSQTLGPLSVTSKIPIEFHDALLEGSRATATVELLRELAVEDDAVAFCSHGDVIPAALSMLADEGMVLIGGRGCDKGSIWELDVRGRDIVSAHYHPASSLSRDPAST